jgi:uncharacterized protein (DUF362 family)
MLRLMATAPVLWGASGLTTLGSAADSPDPSAKSGRSLVTVVKGDDLRKMARESLESLGGAKAFVQPGQTVFIKPNLVTAQAAAVRPIFASGECTKPEIVIAVAEECLKAGAAEVIVGDGAHAPRYSWKAIKTLDGTTNFAAEAERLNAAYLGKVRLACLNADSPEWVDIPTRTSIKKLAVSSLVARADVVISIPVLKTHTSAGLTLAMKNFIGIISNDRHGGYPVRKDIHIAGLEQSFIDVAAAVKPCLAIIDASIGCEGNGPTVDPGQGKGRTVDMRERSGSWMLLASTDLVAADATAARLISHDPAGIKQFKVAVGQGLGQAAEDRIEVKGGKLSELRVKWQPAELGRY